MNIPNMFSGSYSSANFFPVKLLFYIDKFLEKGLFPIHGQFNICNRCQLRCSYCSCSDRDKSKIISPHVLGSIVRKLSDIGMEAATITGGGEPLLHPRFDECMDEFWSNGIKIGLVTNGILLNKPSLALMNCFDWIRISYDGDRKMFPGIRRGLSNLAYSYVRTGDADRLSSPAFKRLLSYAASGRITHLRVVTDINSDEQRLPYWLYRQKGVIAQNRQSYQAGAAKCWISLVKPVIDSDGQFYPCCGVQYAHSDNKRGYVRRMAMGKVDEYISRVMAQDPFNGSNCVKCYYGQYNQFLDMAILLKQVRHINFI